MTVVKMDYEGSVAGVFLFILCGGGVFVYIFFSLFVWKPKEKNLNGQRQSGGSSSSSKRKTESSNTAKHKVQKSKPPSHQPQQKQQFSHPDLQVSFKGHVAPITSGAVSFNGKGLVTASEDRTLFFYSLRDVLSSTAASLQGKRTNISLDHVDKLCWSPDYCAVVAHKVGEQTLEILKGTKMVDGTLGGLNKIREFPKLFTEPIVGLSVASNGRFIMTCSAVSNDLSLWDLQGNLIISCDTLQGRTHHAVLSIDDRLIATSGFTPDVKVWEVVFDKSGAFSSLKKVFHLKGHNSQVFCSHFSTDCTRMVSVSKDGTWCIYNTGVDFAHGDEPQLLVVGEVQAARQATDAAPCIIKLAPDSRTVLVAAGASIYCYSASTALLLRSIDAIYAGPVLDVFFDPGSEFFISVGGQQSYVFHNVAGHLATIQELEESYKKASYSGLAERINTQLVAARRALTQLEEMKLARATKKNKNFGKEAAVKPTENNIKSTHNNKQGHNSKKNKTEQSSKTNGSRNKKEVIEQNGKKVTDKTQNTRKRKKTSN